MDKVLLTSAKWLYVLKAWAKTFLVNLKRWLVNKLVLERKDT